MRSLTLSDFRLQSYCNQGTETGIGGVRVSADPAQTDVETAHSASPKTSLRNTQPRPHSRIDATATGAAANSQPA